jgi:hypothetical protein
VPILPSALGQGLLVGEGVYTTGTPQIQGLLTAAGIGAAPSAAGVSPGGTTATATAATAARVAQLQAAITTQTKNVAVNTAAGKTANAKIDQGTLTTLQAQLKALTG